MYNILYYHALTLTFGCNVFTGVCACWNWKTEKTPQIQRENFTIYVQISLNLCCLTLWPWACASYCLLQESSQHHKALKTCHFFVPGVVTSSTSLFPEICALYCMCVCVCVLPLPWIKDLFCHDGGDSNSRFAPWYQSSSSTSELEFFIDSKCWLFRQTWRNCGVAAVGFYPPFHCSTRALGGNQGSVCSTDSSANIPNGDVK